MFPGIGPVRIFQKKCNLWFSVCNCFIAAILRANFTGKSCFELRQNANLNACAIHIFFHGALTVLRLKKNIKDCISKNFVPPARIEPARHTAIDFESIAATITPRGYVGK